MKGDVRVGDYDIDKGLVLALKRAVKEWLKDKEGKEEER